MREILRSRPRCHTIPYMRETIIAGRSQPRIAMNAPVMCSEIVADKEQFAFVVDISEQGLRLERPLRGRAESRIVQLELELPEVDEIIWAKGEICFDRLRPAFEAGVPGAVRMSGVRLVAAAGRHLRMLRDYVRAAVASAGEIDLMRATHWAG
jgi:hypothetical protein